MKYKYLLVALFTATQLFTVNAVAEELKESLISIDAEQANKKTTDLLKTLREKPNQPFWIQHNYSLSPMIWGGSHWVRESLEAIVGIKISSNKMMGKVEFILSSDSKVTTPEIIKSFKKFTHLAPATMTQTIIPAPKHKYLITLKETPLDNMAYTFSQEFTRYHINTQIICDKIFFNDDTIEIWSDTELDLETLVKDELISRDCTTIVNKKKIITKVLFGGGIKSVKKVEN